MKIEFPYPPHHVVRIGTIDPAIQPVVGDHLRQVVEGAGEPIIVGLIAEIVITHENLSADASSDTVSCRH